jgi:hypothetical protein
MTVLELIHELQQIRVENGGDVEVKFAYDYHDHARTQVCDGIDSVQMLGVVHSHYHDKDRLATEEEMDREPKEICVLR